MKYLNPSGHGFDISARRTQVSVPTTSHAWAAAGTFFLVGAAVLFVAGR